MKIKWTGEQKWKSCKQYYLHFVGFMFAQSISQRAQKMWWIIEANDLCSYTVGLLFRISRNKQNKNNIMMSSILWCHCCWVTVAVSVQDPYLLGSSLIDALLLPQWQTWAIQFFKKLHYAWYLPFYLSNHSLTECKLFCIRSLYLLYLPHM